MSSHKTLKSISHNFGHSFVSYMNYMGTDYFLGLLQSEMRKSNINRLEVDILKNESSPEELLTRKIRKSINAWNKSFPDLVANSGSSMDFVKSAKMTIEFDFNKIRLFPRDNRFTENPYVCEIVIIDDNGKEYKKEQTGWWFPEPEPKKQLTTKQKNNAENNGETKDSSKNKLWSRLKSLWY